MRILHLANHCEEVGNGIVNVAVDLACMQAEAGHAVAYASNGGSYTALFDRHGVQHFMVQSHGTTDLNLKHILLHPTCLSRAFLDVRRVLDRYRPDVIHAHMITGALLAFCMMQGRGMKLVTSVHNVSEPKSIAMVVGHRVIAVSRAVERALLECGIPSRKLRVVCNGPLGSPRCPRSSDAVGAEIESPAIVVVAGLYRRKGIHDLMVAFRTVNAVVPQASLHILGDGPERSNLERQAHDLGLQEKVRFHGFVCDPRPYLQQADVFVLPSHAESFGLAIAEARELGCAIVASNVGGIPEALDGGAAGILVPPQRPEVLATELLRLLQNPDVLQHWRYRAAQNVDWLHCSRVAHETLLIYQDALRSQ
jgi:glycosyltransferase involved in cell wall biosynthesis